MDFPSVPFDPSNAGVSLDAIDVDLPLLDEAKVYSWLSAVAKAYGYGFRSMSYVFCSDTALLEMNVEHLAHDTLTDIITFDLRDAASARVIEGECYISISRVHENASTFGEDSATELLRVMAHGVLHLCGLGDKSIEESEQMRAAEDSALLLWDQ